MLQPLHDRIAVLVEAVETSTESGIYIPTSAEDKPERGVVMMAGPGRVLDDGTVVEMAVKKGDRIIFGKHASGQDVTDDDGITYKMLRESDVIAIVG